MPGNVPGTAVRAAPANEPLPGDTILAIVRGT